MLLAPATGMTTKFQRPIDDPQSFTLIGAGFDVHSEFGPGFSESIHRAAYVVELQRRNVPFVREISYPVLYKGELLPVSYRVDFVCYGEVLVELKAIPAIGPHVYKQLRNYLRVSGLRRGLILNFGTPSLEHRRVVIP